MRVSGNEAWLERDVWKNFIDYERNLNSSLKDQRMIVLCTYPIDKCDAHAVFDVSQVHEMALIKRRGNWEFVEIPAIKLTKSQLAKHKKELEDEVAKRTKELITINKRLKNEIARHKLTHDALLKTEAKLLTVFDATDTAYMLLESDLTIALFNQRAGDLVRKVFHWKLKIEDNIHDFLTADRQDLFNDRVRKAVKGEQISYETNYVLKNESLWYHVRLFPIPKGDKGIFGLVLALTDITERKNFEISRSNYVRQIEIQNEKLKNIAWTQSHIVRAPLARMLGIMNVIEDNNESLDDTLMWLKHLRDSANELDEIIKDMIDKAQHLT